MSFRLCFFIFSILGNTHVQYQHYCLNHTIKNAALTGCYLTTTISEMKLRHIHKNRVIRPPHGTQTRLRASVRGHSVYLDSQLQKE